MTRELDAGPLHLLLVHVLPDEDPRRVPDLFVLRGASLGALFRELSEILGEVVELRVRSPRETQHVVEALALEPVHVCEVRQGHGEQHYLPRFHPAGRTR